MANSLLDFVMSVVRDPDAAARFAADPDQAILDANLTDVTSADVSALIPVVSESMPTIPGTVPTDGLDGGISEVAGNVWTSGAATAAFDAFGDHVPVSAIDDAPSVITDVDQPGQALDAGLDVLADDPSLQFDEPVIDDVPAVESHADSDLGETIVDVVDVDSDPSGFDVF